MEKITIHLSGTNCYLVKNGNHYLLIDTGYAEDWVLFQQQIRQAGVSLAEISHILLTHHHDDHCGLLNRVIQENGNIQVVMSCHAKDLLTKGENDRTRGGGMINHWIQRLWVFKQLYLSIKLGQWVDKKNNLKFPPYLVRENDILLAQDTRLQELGIALGGAIIATPGHTIDSISILLDDGDAFVGDAAANFLQFAGTHYCVVFVTDLAEYYQSWEKILSRHARMILPAHGEPFAAEKLAQNLGKNRVQDLVLI